ncbi:hypothetical protein KSX_11100 [Ktedonospora formicarum]|uniref:Uncharacterized protein n=1 Tax=Ktedonospora formicarum TaxID=2778364 RepID=A0A8J3HS59_9CHLR|nr:hypothetical protein KSX_11100 [Ktedonospora formicarum]
MNLSDQANHLNVARHLQKAHRDPSMEDSHLAKAADVNHWQNGLHDPGKAKAHAPQNSGEVLGAPAQTVALKDFEPKKGHRNARIPEMRSVPLPAV